MNPYDVDQNPSKGMETMWRSGKSFEEKRIRLKQVENHLRGVWTCNSRVYTAMICFNQLETNQKPIGLGLSVVLIIFGVKWQENPAKAGQMINWPENGEGAEKMDQQAKSWASELATTIAAVLSENNGDLVVAGRLADGKWIGPVKVKCFLLGAAFCCNNLGLALYKSWVLLGQKMKNFLFPMKTFALLWWRPIGWEIWNKLDFVHFGCLVLFIGLCLA